MKKLVALTLALLMLLAVTACGKNETTSSDPFISESSAPAPDTDSNTPSDGSSDSAPDTAGTTSKVQQNTTTTKANGSGRTSLTWKQVKAQMPKNLKKTIVVYDWNPAGHTTGAPEALKKFKNETGITVKWVVGDYDSYTTKLTAMVTSGDGKGPDAFRMRWPDAATLKNAKSLDQLNYNFNDTAWSDASMKIYTVKRSYFAVAVRIYFINIL